MCLRLGGRVACRLQDSLSLRLGLGQVWVEKGLEIDFRGAAWGGWGLGMGRTSLRYNAMQSLPSKMAIFLLSN